MFTIFVPIKTKRNMKAQEIFYSETTLNGKFQVMTSMELPFKGSRKTSTNCVTTQKNVIYKNLNNYWVTKKTFELIKELPNSERAVF